MISIFVKEMGGTWFGLAYVGEKIVATAVDSSKERTIKSIVGSIQSGVEYRIAEEGSAFAEGTMGMLRELESGDETSKSFSLSGEYVSEPVAKVLRVAAAIPVGYVTSYGNIAKAADTGPRVVGHIMATNILYPIVPCHRVVGADFSLVGYGGRKNLPALRAKLARLNREARGVDKEKEILVNGRKLRVYPVEYVARKAKRKGLNSFGARALL
jgi:O-6-methylguanine DNA methyltransferase